MHEIIDYDIATGEPYRAVYIEHGTHVEIRPLHIKEDGTIRMLSEEESV